MMRSGGLGSAFARFGAAVVLMFGVVVAVNASAPAAGPRWPVVHTPSPPGPPGGNLFGVSCASATDCMAVGASASDGGGVIIVEQQARFRRWSKVACSTPAECLTAKAKRAAVEPSDVTVSGPDPLIEHWNGTGWSFAPSPHVTNGLLNLTAVDCPAANLCFAVGALATFTQSSFDIQPVVERWDGTTWSTLTLPDVPGSLSTALNGIDCTSATHCVAVGDAIMGNPAKVSTLHDHAVIAEWNGTAWSLASAAAPAGSTDEFLGDVSCSGATCVAVGGYLGGNAVLPLTDTSTGSTWTAGTAPLPADQNNSQFISVACTGATTCTAAGGAWPGTLDEDDPSFTPVAERWNGTTWSLQPAPLPAGTDGAGFYSIACVSASDCTAVGFAQPAGLDDPFGEYDVELHEHWNGSSWSVTPTPDPTPFAALDEVACPAANTCFAVGGTGSLDQWNGTSWFVSHFAGKASHSSLADIDCLSATSCFAVGSYRGDGDQQPLVERWNGSQWQTVAAPAPASGAGFLNAVSCVTARDCTAVGTRSNGDAAFTLVEHWNGSAWKIVPSSSPKGGLPVFDSIDCTATGRCIAVGTVLTDNFTVRAFSAYSRGGRWALASLPIPQFAEEALVTSVSCATATRCFAVGAYYMVTGDRHEVDKVLVAEWNGSRWFARAGAKPPGDAAQLSDVSCVGAKQCYAFGSYIVGEPNSGPVQYGEFVERWDGKTWKLLPDQGTQPILSSGVACRAGNSCFAAGTEFSIDGILPGVAHWNGHKWARVSTGRPAGSTRGGLSAVDCPTSRVCFAVGSYQTRGGSFTLALRGT